MNKSELLKKFILENIPSIKNNPNKIQVFSQTGTVDYIKSNYSFNFALRYKLSLFLTEINEPIENLIYLILKFLDEQQQDLTFSKDFLSYELEASNNNQYSVLFELDLIQAFNVLETEKGTIIKIRKEPTDPYKLD